MTKLIDTASSSECTTISVAKSESTTGYPVMLSCLKKARQLPF